LIVMEEQLGVVEMVCDVVMQQSPRRGITAQVER
jgi:hypothetical protein